ncbi:MAG TPA: PEP-utilizing enzyme [Candidatus Methylomirabilis sp.]|nr:PEP-utilizing enzyme [Candidatus Methylomirabilis sp.]
MSLGNGSNEITWSRMNLKEVLSEMPYPITQSLFEILNKTFFFEQYGNKMGYKLIPKDTEFSKTFYGRLYFNVNITLRIMSDFGSDPELAKMAFGGFQSIELDNQGKLSIIDKTKMIFTFAKIFYNITNINKLTENSFKITRDRYRMDCGKNLKNITDTEVLGYFEFFDDLTTNDLCLIIAGGMNYNYWELRKLLKSVKAIENPDDIINQLVTGTNNIISANQTLEQMRLAGYVKTNSLESELDKNYAEISDPIFKRMLTEFLHKFGHRGLYETCIESPRYYETPDVLLRTIKGYVAEGMVSPEEVISFQKKIREDTIDDILNHKGLSFIKKKLFKTYLNNYTNFMRLREEARYHGVMSIAILRKHVLEAGMRFADRGIIEEQQDIFYLKIPEIKNVLSGEKLDCKKIVSERKSEREQNSRYVVPDVFIGEFKPEMFKANVTRELKTVYSGYAASSGVVQGKARIIRSPDDFRRFNAGEILVAPATDPMWSTLFPIAKAVVTEMGGVLSHASIVAREYGIPCVVNVQGIVAALEDGDLIEVDGANGTVKIIRAI